MPSDDEQGQFDQLQVISTTRSSEQPPFDQDETLFQEPVFTSQTFPQPPLADTDAQSYLDQEVTVYRNSPSHLLHCSGSHDSQPSVGGQLSEQLPTSDFPPVELTDRLRSELQHLYERSPDKGRGPHCKCVHVLQLLLDVLPLSAQARREINQVSSCLHQAPPSDY